MFDVVIVGAGVAGLTAGIFVGRRGLKALIVTKDLGGQTASTSEIENYPGLGRVEGPELIKEFQAQAVQYGCQFSFDEVCAVRQIETHFEVEAGQATHFARSLILAFGKTPRDLDVPGEREFQGRGVSWAIDAKNIEGQDVAVIGGGNSAFEAVLALSSNARKIYLVHRRNEFRGEEILLSRIQACANVEKMTPYAVSAIEGGQRVERLLLEHCETGEQLRLSIQSIFTAIGFEPRAGFLKDFISLDDSNRIIVAPDCSTSRDGVFSAGDITTVPYQQIVISAGEGAKAALSCYSYIMKKRGARPMKVDWGFR